MHKRLAMLEEEMCCWRWRQRRRDFKVLLVVVFVMVLRVEGEELLEEGGFEEEKRGFWGRQKKY